MEDTSKPTDTIPAPMPPVIDAGKARLALASALLNMHRAVYELEATAVAIARALDATVQP